MKKTLLGLLLVIVLVWGLTAIAAPGDVIITLRIPAAKVADFAAGFLAKCPIPIIEDPDYILDPNDPNDRVPIILQYTPKQWFKEWIRRDVMRAYRHGKILLAKQVAIVDPNAIQ